MFGKVTGKGAMGIVVYRSSPDADGRVYVQAAAVVIRFFCP